MGFLPSLILLVSDFDLVYLIFSDPNSDGEKLGEECSKEGRMTDVHDVTVELAKLAGLLDKLYELCCVGGSSNASIATKNGGVELLTSLCDFLHGRSSKPLVSALSSIIHDDFQSAVVLENGFSVIAAASTAIEVLKESFMDLKLDEILVKVLREHAKSCPQSLYDAIHILLTPDDNRVVASKTTEGDSLMYTDQRKRWPKGGDGRSAGVGHRRGLLGMLLAETEKKVAFSYDLQLMMDECKTFADHETLGLRPFSSM
ncbi:hypothetical protein KSP40_PGU004845 [Platanthera guangdongensis]|uniref:Uncharacterized protein n=1 Tax=Platanthera guangdongensis TaxID=2320717 RepID=A0ABR2MFQ2_9ASPA